MGNFLDVLDQNTTIQKMCCGSRRTVEFTWFKFTKRALILLVLWLYDTFTHPLPSDWTSVIKVNANSLPAINLAIWFPLGVANKSTSPFTVKYNG
jgi:hypothetical protein